MWTQLPLFELPPEKQVPFQERLLKEIDATAVHWASRPPGAPSQLIEKLRTEAAYPLPESYLTLLSFSNGPSGPARAQVGWFRIWSAEEVFELNQDYGTRKLVPGSFGFGSDGGGELFAFDVRTTPPYPIVMIPFIPLQEPYAIVIARDFEAFIDAMGQTLD